MLLLASILNSPCLACLDNELKLYQHNENILMILLSTACLGTACLRLCLCSYVPLVFISISFFSCMYTIEMYALVEIDWLDALCFTLH